LIWEIGLIFSLAFVNDHSPYGRDLFETVFYAGSILVPTLFLIFYRYRRRDKWIREEAENFLAQRTAPITPTKKWYRIFWRGMLWTPSLITLSVFLFLPEAMGIVSHAFDLRSHNLNNHFVHPPLTSFVRSYENLYVSALIGRGIARVGSVAYLHKELPLSSLFFYAIGEPRLDHDRDWFLTSENVRSRRTVPFGSETMTCADVTSNSDALKSELVHIMCVASNNDVSADFYGLGADVNTFYEVVKTSTELPTIRIFHSLPPRVPQ
jgi:hypothetical protein